MGRNLKWIMAAGAALTLLPASPAIAAKAPPAEPPPANPATVAPGQRDHLLGAGWQASKDRLWTTSGDAAGLHLMVAEARTGYSWRTVATLAEPGVEADQWIGNVCVTASGQRAVAVYAPRTYTNKEQLTSRGGFTAVIDLNSGAVTKLRVRTSLAYFNPGCGAGEVAALTQEGDDLGKTGIFTLDAARGRLSRRTEIANQVTSATPVDGGIVVADARGLIKIAANGKKTRLVLGSGGVPSDVRADAGGGVVFMDRDGAAGRVRRVAPGGSAVTLATGRPGELTVTSGAAGRLFITGTAGKVGTLPATVRKLDLPVGAAVSTTGDTAVTDLSLVKPTAAFDPMAPQPVRITGRSLRTGEALGFTIDPSTTPTPRWDDTTDSGRVCSVPRNDPAVQVYQPKPKQVEWAVDMAVKGHLDVQRPAGWHGVDGGYTVSSLFPTPALSGGGQVPAQIMLGILGQESNLWQASKYAMPGEYGNPLIGNYYGLDLYNDDPADDWTIDWDAADCGYGVSQMTDGMRLAGHPKPTNPDDQPKSKQEQVAIATDYAANVAAGLRLLADKWNYMQAWHMTVNNNDPARIENWFLAVWAYNSGFHIQGEAGSNGAYGLGWLNNPINPRYPARSNFGADPHDYAHPQFWPYPEKVLGFAANPPSSYEAPGTPAVPFFRAASWNGLDIPDENQPGTAVYNRKHAVPPHEIFCVTAEDCDVNGTYTPTDPDVVGEPAGPCAHRNTAGQYDLKCWVHHSVTWKPDCASTCGREFIRYDYPDFAAEPADGVSYPPQCDNAGLAANAAVIDDVSGATKSIRVPLCNIRANSGSFGFTFGQNSAGQQSGKIDLHQIGGGYGAHYWFTHSSDAAVDGTKLAVVGTWTFTPVVDGLARVMVHLPAHAPSGGNSAGAATYTVFTAQGEKRVKLNQYGDNQWVSLGVFSFFGPPKVQLTNMVTTGEAPTDVVYDAMAVQPVAGEVTPPYNPEIRSTGDLCLMANKNSAADGGYVQTRGCEVWTSNYWSVTRVSPNPGAPAQYWYIMDRGTGKCLEIEGASTAPGARAREGDCNPTDPNQQWYGIGDRNSSELGSPYTIRNLHSRLCLGAGDNDADGSIRVVQDECNGIAYQDWIFKMY